MSELREEKKIEVLDRLNALSRKELKGRDPETVSSLASYVRRKNRFTPPQWGLLQILEERYSEATLAREEEWNGEYFTKYREKALVCASYYYFNGVYNVSLSRKILNDKEFIPTESQYKKLCENKYAVRVLEQWYAEPKYKEGELVRLRQGVKLPRGKSRFRGLAFVIKTNSSYVTSACRGAKKYLVLPIGSQKPIHFEERHIKHAKQKRRKKNEG